MRVFCFLAGARPIRPTRNPQSRTRLPALPVLAFGCKDLQDVLALAALTQGGQISDHIYRRWPTDPARLFSAGMGQPNFSS